MTVLLFNKNKRTGRYATWIFGFSGLSPVSGLDTQRCSVSASDNDADDASPWRRHLYDVILRVLS